MRFTWKKIAIISWLSMVCMVGSYLVNQYSPPDPVEHTSVTQELETKNNECYLERAPDWSLPRDDNFHTDTPEPVCPWCESKGERTGYWNKENLTEVAKERGIAHGWEDKGYTWHYIRSVEDMINPNFYRCNKCSKDFTIDKHRLTKTENDVTYTSDEWYYTTERIK